MKRKLIIVSALLALSTPARAAQIGTNEWLEQQHQQMQQQWDQQNAMQVQQQMLQQQMQHTQILRNMQNQQQDYFIQPGRPPQMMGNGFSCNRLERSCN